ncbi:cadmium resistance transporter [Cyanobium sp. FGCU-6]|nr:cadmium resistance transporter [Cyanobium sp. FGCU6]
MEWLWTTLQIAFGAGLATTFDDTIYLTGFFSEVDRSFRPRHVVVGELLGFTLLLCISLLGFALGLAIPRRAIGLLGVLPILIGLSSLIALWRGRQDTSALQPTMHPVADSPRGFVSRRPSLIDVLRDRRTYSVSLVTVSNGSNNLTIYIPLFASLTLGKIAVLIPVFYGFIALWLFLSFHLTRFPAIAVVLHRYARRVFPFILMWLGVRILHDTGAIALLWPFSG